MTFAVSGGIEWEKDTVNGVLTIRPTNSPESGYTSGQMRDFTSQGEAPWGVFQGIPFTLRLEEGITHIGAYAFYFCYGLASITIPSSVITIGDYAFYRCEGSGTLTIPDNVTSIGAGAFYQLTGFNGLIIGNGVKSIGSGAFSNCVFVSIVIGESLESIGSNTFFNIIPLTGEITFPKSLTSIEYQAFANCENVSDIKFLGEKPTLGAFAFKLLDDGKLYTKTYNVHSNGWANKTTFPEYTHVKWNYKTFGLMYGKINATWVKGKPFVKVGGHYKKVVDSFSKVGGHWKKSI